jgi:peptidoglycan-associated lipoprotein
MVEVASTASTQAQALSQDAERLKAQAAMPLPKALSKAAPTTMEEKGPALIEVPSGLVPEKETQLFPSLQQLGRKKEKEKSPLQDVFFEFDQFLLSEGARRILEKNAEWLRSHPQAQVLIEGHCDERGTVEYNLALGERRAQSAKDYLMNLGVSKDRLSVISYGKEKPFALGHEEEAWVQNRRAHFLLRFP